MALNFERTNGGTFLQPDNIPEFGSINTKRKNYKADTFPL